MFYFFIKWLVMLLNLYDTVTIEMCDFTYKSLLILDDGGVYVQ